MIEPWMLSALELARQIATREISCDEVVESHLNRIAEINPAVNAIVCLLDTEARAAARAADAKVASGEPLGSLHGVPFTVKDNIDMAGLATTWGVPALAGAIAPMDAPIVERMRIAGAIPIGRTNLPDLALRVHTDSSLHGLTRNPWNASRTAGGSSGGEAVALATGMSAIGLGNDLGGSLRSPASACGVASIRPSLGRVPDAGYVPSEDRLLAVQLMNVAGPMARTVADVRAALRVMIGAHPRDPWAVDMPFEGARNMQPIRVAVVAEPPGGNTDPVIAAIVRRCADVLAAAGYDVIEACPARYEEAADAWAQFLLGDYSLLLPRMLSMIGDDARAFVEAARARVPALDSAASMSALMMQRDGIARTWSRFLADTPLILSPTWTQLPFETGFDVASLDTAAATLQMIRPLLPANLLGLPSACVPAGVDANSGLPVGVLLTGRPFREDLCLDAAEAIERQSGVKTPIDPRP